MSPCPSSRRMVNTGDPDIDMVQPGRRGDRPRRGRRAAAEPTDQKKKKGDQAPVTGGSVGSLDEGYAANQSERPGSAC